MKLLDAKLRQQLPPLHSSENVADPTVVCKFTLPEFAWDWYAIEFDGKDTFFGYVTGEEPELGYFSLSELEGTEGSFYPPVELDCSFKPQPLSQVRKRWKRWERKEGQG